MKDVRLKTKKRSFPSQGRIRINVGLLSDIGIKEGDKIDIVNEETGKIVTATVIADSMVEKDEIRVSGEDLASLGTNEGDFIIVRKTPPLKERAAKIVQGTEKRVAEESARLDASFRKTAVEVKASAEKAAHTIKKEAGKAGKKVKSAIDENRGKGKDL